jgi:hypothetical protein
MFSQAQKSVVLNNACVQAFIPAISERRPLLSSSAEVLKPGVSLRGTTLGPQPPGTSTKNKKIKRPSS